MASFPLSASQDLFAGVLAQAAWPVRLPVPDAHAWQSGLRLGVYEAADAVPVRDLERDWAVYRPHRGNHAVVQVAHAELTVALRDWELALTSRNEGLLMGSRDAFDLVHAYKRKQNPAPGTSLQVAVRADGLWLSGLRVARSGDLVARASTAVGAASTGWRWTLAATGLTVRRAVSANVHGQASFDAGGAESYSATAWRSDTSKSFGGFGHAGGRGVGVTFDAGLAWRGPGELLVNFSAVDLWSRIEVDGAATQAVRLSSQTLGTDADGYLEYRPALTGRNQARTLRMRLEPKWSVSMEGPLPLRVLGPTRIGVQWARMGSLDRPSVWWSLPLVAGWKGSVELDPRFDAIGIGLSGPSLSLMLRAGVDAGRRTRPMGGQLAWRWSH